MEENNKTTMVDERTMLLNRGIGIVLVALGIYGLMYAYKFYKNK
jgi:hypothetical protein